MYDSVCAIRRLWILLYQLHSCTVGWETAPKYFTALKHGNIPECTSLCDNFGYDYTWCRTGAVESNSWDYCSRDDQTTIYSYKCLSPCKRIDGEFQCFVLRKGVNEACSPTLGPDAVNASSFCDIESSILAGYGQYTDAGFQKCTSRAKWFSPFECAVRDLGVEAMAQSYERIHANARTFITPPAPTVSVASYVAIRRPPIQQLTLVVRASIYPRHLNNPSENVPSYIGVRMNWMNCLSNDEQGYLVAASLGGPTHDFNFVPQTTSLNRRYSGNSYWYTIEGEIRWFLRRSDAGHVECTVVIGYNLTNSLRPTGFGLRFLEYDNLDNLVHDSGDCFFTNDPAGGCIIWILRVNKTKKKW